MILVWGRIGERKGRKVEEVFEMKNTPKIQLKRARYVYELQDCPCGARNMIFYPEKVLCECPGRENSRSLSTASLLMFTGPLSTIWHALQKKAPSYARCTRLRRSKAETLAMIEMNHELKRKLKMS